MKSQFNTMIPRSARGTKVGVLVFLLAFFVSSSLVWHQLAVITCMPMTLDRITIPRLVAANISCINHRFGVSCGPKEARIHLNVPNQGTSKLAGNGEIFRHIILHSNTSSLLYSFGLGFFQTSPGDFYLSIYIFTDAKDTNKGMVVWTANHGQPVGENATFVFTTLGTLELRDSNKSMVWEASSFGQVAESMQFEMFTGNLVLRDRSKRMLWQSLKYPKPDTDLVEATQMLQYGKSWKVEGDCNHAEDHNYPKLHSNMINKRYLLDSPCASTSACGSYGICNTTTNSTKNYKTCTCPTSGNFTFRPLNSSNPSAGCGFPEGEYMAPTCNSTTASFMILQTGVDYGVYTNDNNQVGVHQGQSLTVNDCSMYCQLNCSCQGAFYNILTGLCVYTYKPIQSLRVSNSFGHVAFLKIQKLATVCAPATTQIQSWRSLAKYGVLYIGIPVVVFVGTCVLLIWWMRLKVRKHKIYAAEGRQFHNIINRFSYKELDLATNGFATKLGEGGFGGVYAGQLRDPHGVMIQVAVKRLHPKKGSGGGDNILSDDPLDDFMAEVETLGRIDHVNLVRLWGYCVEKPHRLLVYEYMANGSLYKPLFNPHGSNIVLDWGTRQRIAIETARGLNYLHNDCSNKIIHLDIKPANILLDDNLHAKVADFGLSILLDREQGFIEMTQCKGTIGYIAPEIYSIQDAAITEKADVFSYGIVLLELLCGRKNSSCVEDWWLAPYAQQMLKDGNVNEVLDYQLQQPGLPDTPRDEAMTMFQIAFWCMQYEPSWRPSMHTVLKWLQGETPLPAACAPNISPEPLVGNGRINPADIWRNNLDVLRNSASSPALYGSLRARIDAGRKKKNMLTESSQVGKLDFQESADIFSCSLDVGR